jgi:hypothetical protein
LVQINKDEKEFLIKNGYLKAKMGKYPDLTITSRNKKSRRKIYYVPDYYVNYLKNDKENKNNEEKLKSNNIEKSNKRD